MAMDPMMLTTTNDKQIHDVDRIFRKKTKCTIRILVFLFLSIIAPIFGRTVDGLLTLSNDDGGTIVAFRVPSTDVK